MERREKLSLATEKKRGTPRDKTDYKNEFFPPSPNKSRRSSPVASIDRSINCPVQSPVLQHTAINGSIGGGWARSNLASPFPRRRIGGWISYRPDTALDATTELDSLRFCCSLASRIHAAHVHACACISCSLSTSLFSLGKGICAPL